MKPFSSTFVCVSCASQHAHHACTRFFLFRKLVLSTRRAGRSCLQERVYVDICFYNWCLVLQSVDMAGHNTSLFVLGVMILWFGWYGFNPGSQGIIISPVTSTYSAASAVANSAVTTTLAPAASGITGLFLTAFLLKKKTGKHHWDIMAMGNSTLAGLVAITAGCSTVYPWAAVVIGIVAGIIYPLASRLMILIKVGLHAWAYFCKECSHHEMCAASDPHLRCCVAHTAVNTHTCVRASSQCCSPGMQRGLVHHRWTVIRLKKTGLKKNRAQGTVCLLF